MYLELDECEGERAALAEEGCMGSSEYLKDPGEEQPSIFLF